MSSQNEECHLILKCGSFVYARHLHPAYKQDLWGALGRVGGGGVVLWEWWCSGSGGALGLFLILLDAFISDTLQYFVSSGPCAHLFVNSITWVINHSCMKVSKLISNQQAMYWLEEDTFCPPPFHGFSSSLAPTHTPGLWCTYIYV